MSSLIDFIHRLLDIVITGLFSVLESLGPLAALSIISLISGVILVFIYGKVSFQNKIRVVKRSIHAALLEVILFRHSPILSLKAQGRMLQGGIKYLLLAVPPILILAVPCIFLMAQLQSWFGYEGMHPGASAIVKASIPADRPLDAVTLSSVDSVGIIGPLRGIAEHELVWRVEPQQQGSFPMQLNINGTAPIPMELVVTEKFSRIDSLLSSSPVDKFLYPARASSKVPKSFIDQLEVSYPEHKFAVWGWHLHWVVIFLVLSLISGLVGGKLLKVEL